jgi:NAD-dependent DNA ligase
MSFQASIPRMTDPKLRGMERDLMAHRYLYYVMELPVISDTNYDMSERAFLRMNIGDLETVINHPGSCLESSYTADEIELAKQKLEGGRR